MLERLRRPVVRVARRALAIGVVSALLTGAAVAASPNAASAATPYCATYILYQNAFVPASAAGGVDCVMAQGAMGGHVWALQMSLNACNLHENLATDSIFGGQTWAALVRLQSALGIQVDGVYGPQTRRAMQHRTISADAGCKRIWP